jgi:hypothetical protein
MSSYQNPSEKLSALQKKLNGWKEELRDEMQCIPNLIGLHDEYKSVAAYLQDKSGEIEDDFRALVQCRLKFEKSRTSPGLIAVVLSYLLMPFCLGASFINLFTKRTQRAYVEACKYFECLQEKAVVNTDIRANESLYVSIIKNLDPDLRMLIAPKWAKVLEKEEWFAGWSTPSRDFPTWPFSVVYLTVVSMLIFSVADLVYGCFPSWLVPSESIITALQFLPAAPSESMFYGLLLFTLPYFLGDSADGKLGFLLVAPLLGLLLLQALHWLPVGVSAVYYLIAGLYLVAFLIYRSESLDSPLGILRDNRRTIKIKSKYGSEDEIYGLIRDAQTAELNFWNIEIEDKERLIESTESSDIPRIQNTIEKLQNEINVENARWEGLSEINKLAEIKAVEEIKTLKNKQENDDLVAKELMESSKRQAAAAEQQAIAARDAARAQEQQAAAARDAARDAARAQEQQAAAAQDLARTAAEAANACVYCRVRNPVGPCHKSPHGQHRFG